MGRLSEHHVVMVIAVLKYTKIIVLLTVSVAGSGVPRCYTLLRPMQVVS